MMALLQSTQKGRQPLQRRKLLQTILCATVLYSILYVPNYAAIWRDLLEVDASLVLNGVPGYHKVVCVVVHSSGICCDVCASLSDSSDLQHHHSSCYQCSKEQALGSVICFLLFLGPCILYLWKVNLSGVSVVGGLLPQLTFQNGQVMLYGVYWIGMLAAVGGSFLAIRKNTYRSS